MRAIELRDLCKSFYAIPVIDHLSLQIEAGEMFGLLGPDGAGKTTLLNMMSGLVVPDRGEIEVLGYRLPQEACGVHRLLGVVQQATAFYENLTAWDNLAVFANFSCISHQKKCFHIYNVLTRVQLLKDGQSRVSTFSAGMKRRLALGCALLADPPLLYLDELTAGVDVQERFALWDYVRALRTLNKTCVVATSSFEEACILCDRIALMVAGRLLMIDVPEHFKQCYGDIVIELELSHPFTSFNVLNALQGVKKSWSSPQMNLVGASPGVRPAANDVFLQEPGARQVTPLRGSSVSQKSVLQSLQLSIIALDSKVLPQIIALVTQECEIKELRVRALRLDEMLLCFDTEVGDN